MSPVEISYVGIGILILLLLLRMQIGVCMGLVGFVGFAYVIGIDPALGC